MPYGDVCSPFETEYCSVVPLAQIKWPSIGQALLASVRIAVKIPRGLQ